MDFGKALEYIKNGKSVTRNCWNGKKDIYLTKGTDLQKSLQYGYGEYEGEPTIGSVITMYDGNNIIIGWQPTSEDMLANDWSLLSAAVETHINDYTEFEDDTSIIRIKKDSYVFTLYLYKEIDPNIKYNIIITLNDDYCDGFLNDNVLYIINPETKEIVAESTIKIPSISIISDILCELVSIYFSSSTLVIERNKYGLLLIDMIIKTTSIKNNLYKRNGTYGFSTTKNTISYMEKFLSSIIIPFSIINSSYLKKIMDDLILFKEKKCNLMLLHNLRTFLIGMYVQ